MKNILFVLVILPSLLFSQTLPPKPTNLPLRTRIATDANTRDSIRMEAKRRADSAFMAARRDLLAGLETKMNVADAQGYKDSIASLVTSMQVTATSSNKSFNDSIRNALSAGLSLKQNQSDAKSFNDSVRNVLKYKSDTGFVTQKLATKLSVSDADLKFATVASDNLKLSLTEADIRYPAKAAVMSRDSINALMTAVKSSTDSIKTKVLFTQTATQTVAASALKTTIVGSGVGSLTIPANTLTPGKTFRIHITGVYSTPPLLNLGTITCRMEINSTIISTASAITLLASATNSAFTADAEITFRTVGSGGSLVSTGSLNFNSSLNTRSFIDMNTGMSTVSINTTIPLTFNPTVQWSSAVAGHSVSSLICTLEALN